MKRLIVFFSIVIIAITSMAQTPKDEVTLTVTGSGTTKEEAVNNALRSAIAQSYGVFVSANTQILNDSLVRDEIATVTSGNIKDYKEIAATDLGNGRKEVTLSATVSISKLINYANSKGASAEFAGAVFARNMKIRELNKANELVVMKNLLNYISISLPYCYDRKLEISEARMYHNNDDNKDYVAIPMEIKYIPNENLKKCVNKVDNILKSLALKKDEIDEYFRLKEDYYGCCIKPELYNPELYNNDLRARDSLVFWLRNDYSDDYNRLKIDTVFSNYFGNISIVDNTNKVSNLKLFCGSGYHDIIKKTGLFENIIDEGDIRCYMPNAYRDGIVLLICWDCYLTENTSIDVLPSVLFTINIPKEDIDKYSSFKLID